MGLAANQFTNTNTNFSKVTFNVTDGYQTIEPIDVTVTIVGANNTTVYDGEEHSVEGYTATASTDLFDVTKDFTFSGKAEAARTDAGQTDMGLAAEQFENTNANFATVTFDVTDGYQAITPVTDEVVVTITGASDEATYDGKEHTVTGYTVEISNELYTEDDFQFTPKEDADLDKDGNIIASRTNVFENGEEPAEDVKSGTTNMGMTKDDFANLSQNFTNIKFVVEDGSITINKRPLTIISGSATKPYDGTPLKENSYELEGSVADTDELTVVCSGSQTQVGSSENPFTWDVNPKPVDTLVTKVLKFFGLAEDAFADETTKANYDVTEVNGTLTVTEPESENLVMTKTHVDENGNTQTYQVGDTVTFTITVTNIYDEAKDITITEQAGVTITGDSEFKGVEPDAKVTTTATYTVTEDDIKAGTFTNTAEAKFTGESGETTHSNKDVVDTFAHMTVTKVVTNKPADGKAFVNGETIKYEITVTNDGTQAMTDIVVKDELTGDEWKVDKLDAGKSKTFKAEYKVTDKDAAAGSVTNVAVAAGNDADGDSIPGVEAKAAANTAKAPEGGSPKTGDTTPIVEYSVMLSAALGLLLMIIRRRKERA